MQLFKMPPAAANMLHKMERRVVEDLEYLAEANPNDGMLLHSPPAGWLMDFERNTLAGRLGAGFSMLLMDALGFPYAGPFDVLYPNIKGAKPDFVFQQPAGPEVLVEAKGSLTSNDSVRSAVRTAVRKQIKPHLNAASAAMGLAVGSAATDHNNYPYISVYEAQLPTTPSGPGQIPSKDALAVAQWFAAFRPQLFKAHWSAALMLCGFHRAAMALRENRLATQGELDQDGFLDPKSEFISSAGLNVILGPTNESVGTTGGRLRFGFLADLHELLVKVLSGKTVLGLRPESIDIRPIPFARKKQQEMMGLHDRGDQDTNVTHFSDGLVAMLTDFKKNEAPEPSSVPDEAVYFDGDGGTAAD